MKRFLLLGILLLIISNGFSQTISKPDRSAIVCLGTDLGVTFSITGSFTDGSEFEVQLSDKTGSFSSYTTFSEKIPYVSSKTEYSGLFLVDGIDESVHYRVRVKSTNPQVTSSESDEFRVIQNDPFNIVADGPTEFCAGGYVVLKNANFIDTKSYNWYKKDFPNDEFLGTGRTWNADRTGEYYALSTGNCVEESQDHIQVQVTTTPTSVILEAESGTSIFDVCKPGTFTFNANSTGVDNPYYEWIDSKGDVVGTGTSFTTGVPGDYFLRTTNYGGISVGGGCPDDSAPVTLVVHDFVSEILEQPNSPIIGCEGTNETLTANLINHKSGYIYHWFKDNIEITGLVQPATSIDLQGVVASNGTYRLEVESPACTKVSGNVVVTFVLTPTSQITPSIDEEICLGEEYTFTEDSYDKFGTTTYQWIKDGVDIVGATNSTYKTGIAGIYTLRTTNDNVCSDVSDPVELKVKEVISEIGVKQGALNICEGSVLELESKIEKDPTYIYHWFKDGVEITGLTQPAINYVVPSGVTQGAANSGSYTLKIESAVCSDVTSAAKDVLIKPVPVFDVFVNSQLDDVYKGCNNDNVDLISSLIAPDYIYLWKLNGLPAPGENNKPTYSFNLNSATEGVYSLEMSFAGDCSTESQVEVILVDSPTSIIEPSTESIACEDDVVVLTAFSQGNILTYQWLLNGVPAPGINNQSTYDAAVSGNYSLKTTSDGTCSTVSTGVDVIISPKAIPKITSVTGLFADCSIITLDATSSDLRISELVKPEDAARVVYEWYDENDNYISSGERLDVVELGSHVYKLKALNYGLCSDVAAEATVTINDLNPEIDEVSSDIKLCEGNNHTLNSFEDDPSYTYIWYRDGVQVQNSNSPTYYISSSVLGVGSWSYTLRVISPECDKLSNTPIVVDIKAKPKSEIVNGNIDACENDNLIVLLSKDTESFYSYKWFKDGVEIADSTRSELVVNVSDNANVDTKYRLEVSYGESCTETSTEINIHKVKTPISKIDLEGDQVVCGVNNTILLTAVSENLETPVAYEWLLNGVIIPGATGLQYEATVSGDYVVRTKNRGICLDDSNPTTVIITPEVIAKISPKGNVNVCDEVLLQSISDEIGPNTTYEWYYNDVLIPTVTGASLNANQEGKYYFKAYNYGVCGSQSEDVNVTFTEFEHEIEEAPLARECIDHDIVLHSINTDETNFEFAWYNDDISPFPLPNGDKPTFVVEGKEANSGIYYLKVTEKGKSCSKQSEPVEVVILPSPVSNINLGGGFNCEGSVVTLNSQETNEHYDYTWYFNDNEIFESDPNYQDVNSPRLSVTMFRETEGVYTVKVSIGSCDSGMSNAVMLDMYDLNPELDVDPGMVLCRDGSIALTAITNDNDDVDSYRWFRDGNPITGETLETTIVDHIGRYKAEVTSKNSGCVQYTDEVDISLVPFMGVVEDTIYSNSGQDVTFEAYGGDSYVWFDSDGDIVQTGLDKFIVDNVQGNLSYQVKISNGYCDEVFDLLIVSGEITADDIQNLMTPNGDGFNDTWKLPPGFVSSGDEVILLNRQGNEVYRSDDYKDDWSGTFNDGPNLPAATYYYVIKRKGKEPIMGSVTIFR